ncbi:hypothetical protein SUDANB6_01055 [Streptomyces sp. enrichment culture]
MRVERREEGPVQRRRRPRAGQRAAMPSDPSLAVLRVFPPARVLTGPSLDGPGTPPYINSRS